MTILAGIFMVIVLAAAGYMAGYMVGFIFVSIVVVLWLCVRAQIRGFDHG